MPQTQTAENSLPAAVPAPTAGRKGICAEAFPLSATAVSTMHAPAQTSAAAKMQPAAPAAREPFSASSAAPASQITGAARNAFMPT